MAKFIQTVSIALLVSVAICSASPARLEKLKPSKSKILARQEVAVDISAQTPYPPSGIKPEIPFNLPTDEKLIAPANYYLPPLEGEPAKFYSPPSQVYGPPAQTYGPPEVSVKDDVEEIAKDEPVQTQEQPEEQQPEEVQPDEIEPEQSEEPQQPRDEQQVDNNDETQSEQKDSEVEQGAVEDGVNNTLPERIVQAKNKGKKAAKLRSAKLQVSPAVPLRRQAGAAQPVYLGALYAYNGQLYRL